MQKAFDTILESEVLAKSVAQAVESGERYRYECANCGEEVYLAAVDSKQVVAHFRHRDGNNNVECENYFRRSGMISTDSRSRKSNQVKADFYFDNSSKNFSVGLRFSENEILNYEQQDADFELRTKNPGNPVYSLKINSKNFSPKVPTKIALNVFSFSYYISNTCNSEEPRKYDFLKNTPTFFKILGNDEDFKAQLVRGDVLYTNTRYFFAAIQNRYQEHEIWACHQIKWIVL